MKLAVKVLLLVLSYLFAASVSGEIYYDMAQTNWLSLWTYVTWEAIHLATCVSLAVVTIAVVALFKKD